MIERDLRSCLPACLFACSFLSSNGQPRASRASCCCCFAQPRRFKVFVSTCIGYLYITSRDADLICRHSHPLQTRTITCATLIAASVPAHAVAQGRQQLSSSSMNISYQCSCIYPYHHHPLLPVVAFQSFECQLQHEYHLQCLVQYRYADCVLGLTWRRFSRTACLPFGGTRGMKQE